jgi:predicted CXXCH cytochrome family protein
MNYPGQDKAGVPNREMRGVKLHRLSVCVLILAVLAACISGCSEETKHTVLTFFFTGVPPPEEEKKDELEKDTSAQAVEQIPTIVTVYTHPVTAANLCNECHQTTANFALFGRSKRTASFQKGAMSPGPLVVDSKELCVRCHKDKSASEVLTAGLWMHPTSAKGECHACHDPHQSTHQYILLEEPAKICTRCHKEDDMLVKVKDKEAHKLPSDCLSCHNPHLGKDRALLTKDYKEVKHPVGPLPGLPSSPELSGSLPGGAGKRETESVRSVTQ